MALRYWFGGTGTWDTTSTANWSAAVPLSFTASCSGTALTTTGSPALVVGMTVHSSTNVSLGTVSSGSGNSWVVSVGGTYASQIMKAATVGVSVPTTADTVSFVSSSSGTSAYTVTLTGALNCSTFSASSNTPTFAGTGTLGVSGTSFFLGTGMTWSATGTITFTGSNVNVTTNGVTIGASVTYNGGSANTMTLANSLTLASTRTFTLSLGTLNLVSYTLTTGFFVSNLSGVRSIAFGTGNITLNGAGGTLWNTATITSLTTTGTPVVNVSYTGALATTITPGSLSEANSISFSFTAGTYSLTMTAGSYLSLNFTGFAGTVANTANTIYGNLTLASGATYTAGANAWTFASTSATPRTITSNGKTIGCPVSFNGVGGTWALQDAMTMGTTQSVSLTNGTLDLSGKTLTAGSSSTFQTVAGTKNLTFNGGTLVCPASTPTAFNNLSPTNFTTTAGTGTGTISMTGASSKEFVGGGSNYNCTINQGGAGALTISGANTFNNITNTTQPATVLFPSSTTSTFNNFSLSGTAGNLITLNSSASGTQSTLLKTSGTVSSDYLSITDSAATGGASWYAGANSTNVSNNTGWFFTGPSGGSFFSVL